MSHAEDELQAELNRLAGTTGNSACKAANVWAGTTGLEILGALNAKNGTSGLSFGAVCNALASTTGLEPLGALLSLSPDTGSIFDEIEDEESNDILDEAGEPLYAEG